MSWDKCIISVCWPVTFLGHFENTVSCLVFCLWDSSINCRLSIFSSTKLFLYFLVVNSYLQIHFTLLKISWEIQSVSKFGYCWNRAYRRFVHGNKRKWKDSRQSSFLKECRRQSYTRLQSEASAWIDLKHINRFNLERVNRIFYFNQVWLFFDSWYQLKIIKAYFNHYLLKENFLSSIFNGKSVTLTLKSVFSL
jgi:hypothetical protein